MSILAIYQDNYADEFDVYGFRIFDSHDAWEKYSNTFPEDKSFKFYFGTNEEITYKNRAALMERFSLEVVYEDFAQELHRLFPMAATYGYGTIPFEYENYG